MTNNTDGSNRLAQLQRDLADNQAQLAALATVGAPSIDLAKEERAALERMTKEQALTRQAQALRAAIAGEEAKQAAELAQVRAARQAVLQREIDNRAESLAADVALLSARAQEIHALAVELTAYTGPHVNGEYAAWAAQLAELASVISPAAGRQRTAKFLAAANGMAAKIREANEGRKRKALADARLQAAVNKADNGAWA